MIGQKIQSFGLKGSRENFAQREKHGIPNRQEEGLREVDEAKCLSNAHWQIKEAT